MFSLKNLTNLLAKNGKVDPAVKLESIGLDTDAVLAQVRKGRADRDTVMRLVSELLQKGQPVPPEIELYTLDAYIADDPGRIDLKKRMVHVLKILKRPVPEYLLTEVRNSYLSEEKQTDFQALMAEYGAEVGYRDLEASFIEDMEKVRRYTMTSVERLYAMMEATQYVIHQPVKGALVECGVWRGGSMMLAALQLKRCGKIDRDLWLYDTYSGLPRPDSNKDVDVLGNRAIDGWEPRNISESETLWAYADQNDVRTNMVSTGYPEEKMHFIKGLVEETIPENGPSDIALLRIDTDWYESYRHILGHFYDRVVSGGVIIFDDYGQFLGARQAVDEFRNERGIHAPFFRIDYSGRLMIKL